MYKKKDNGTGDLTVYTHHNSPGESIHEKTHNDIESVEEKAHHHREKAYQRKHNSASDLPVYTQKWMIPYVD